MADIKGARYVVAGTTRVAALDVYPVGLLHDWKRGRLWRGLRFVARELRRGQWHEARQSLNGYLAEAEEHVPGTWRCGRGWTRCRAVRSWVRHAEANAHG